MKSTFISRLLLALLVFAVAFHSPPAFAAKAVHPFAKLYVKAAPVVIVTSGIQYADKITAKTSITDMAVTSAITYEAPDVPCILVKATNREYASKSTDEGNRLQRPKQVMTNIYRCQCLNRNPITIATWPELIE